MQAIFKTIMRFDRNGNKLCKTLLILEAFRRSSLVEYELSRRENVWSIWFDKSRPEMHIIFRLKNRFEI